MSLESISKEFWGLCRKFTEHVNFCNINISNLYKKQKDDKIELLKLIIELGEQMNAQEERLSVLERENHNLKMNIAVLKSRVR